MSNKEFFHEKFDPIFGPPCSLRILMLTDDDGSFTKEHRFGLTELIHALKTSPHAYVSFAITTAHRSHETGVMPFPKDAKIKDFRFDNPAHFNAADFDQIWLFGVGNYGPTSTDALTEKELRIVSQFMDNGGGVFATGDHENLGADLCGRLPRVRSMRRWKFDYSAVLSPHSYLDYDESSGDAPPVLGPHRHDTLVPGHDASFSFDDQSDDIPAPIIPKFYGYQNRFWSIQYPHPLLCGPKGIINILPDHMHEGECVIPDDLTQSTTFDGYTHAEYPIDAGIQAIPDVIADGVIQPGHKTRLELKDSANGMPGQTQESSFLDVNVVADRFGVIGAYDGHVVKVGRVVVDSTFHHFFNINLDGAHSNSSDPVKQLGFLASTEGQKSYDQIKSYFRNIALWLAPPAVQKCMFENVLWVARWDSQIHMLAPGLSRDVYSWENLLAYGRQVREVLERNNAARCTVVDWIFAQDNPLARFPWWELINRPDPPPWDIRKVMTSPEVLVTATLGAIMGELVRAAPSRNEEFRNALHRHMPKIMTAGTATGLRQAASFFEECLAETTKFVQTVKNAAAADQGNVNKKGERKS